MNDDEREQRIEEKGLTAPRVSIGDILTAIASESYHRLDATNITICVLHLKNGYTVTGQSACVSAENYDQALGESIARQKAIEKCWALFGFQLASELSGWRLDHGE